MGGIGEGVRAWWWQCEEAWEVDGWRKVLSFFSINLLGARSTLLLLHRRRRRTWEYFMTLSVSLVKNTRANGE